MKYFLFICSLFFLSCSNSPKSNNYSRSVIYNGIPWFDDRDSIVNAHGACIVEDGGRYYLFGEYKSNGVNAFYGFSCYSSDDLVNWKFERIVLGVQSDGILGSDRIGERVKVMKCPSTGEYVMYMHCDNKKYTDPHIGYATSPTINGHYKFHGPLLHDGEPIRRWDMGTYQDTDGKGYLLIHHGIIYRLSDDYRSAETKILDHLDGSGESPAMLKKDGTYYMLNSNLTSWERNDNFYYTANSIEGPWTYQGLFAPKGSLTYNSQCSFVFPIVHENDTVHMYMGDRWSFPNQSDAATQVWLPMQIYNGKLSIPEYWPAWDFKFIQKVDPTAGSITLNHDKIKKSKEEDWLINNSFWTSSQKDSYLEVSFEGSKCGVIGISDSTGGYGKVTILNSKGDIQHSSLIDFYSKVKDKGVRFISPLLPHDNYIIRVEVTGIIPEWFQKNGTRFGSSSCNVMISDFIVFL